MGLKKYLGDSSIIVKARYKRTRSIRPLSTFLESESKLDVQSFEGTDASDHNWGPMIVEALEKTNKELAKIKQNYQSDKRKWRPLIIQIT